MAAAGCPGSRLLPVRNLHFVLKIADRTETAKFFRQTLGMQVLRHEEFNEGCAASCNGPYSGMWSKTMIGYGDEAEHFVLELTYNYGLDAYEHGNDFRAITISSPQVYAALQRGGLALPGAASASLRSPDGYSFTVSGAHAPGACPITEVALSCASLPASLAYWAGLLGLEVEARSECDALLRCSEGGCRLRLVQLPAGEALVRGSAFGRIAFSCPGERLQQLQADVLAAGYAVHTPYVSLDTPGKATVQVVILADPDGHEICFVGDEGFRQLSTPDPQAAALLDQAVAADGSKGWYERREAAMAAARAAK